MTKKKMREYLSLLGVREKAHLSRVDYVVQRVETVAGEPLEDFIIEDVIDQEGDRVYLHIVGFTKQFIVSVQNFITEGDVHIYPFPRRLLGLSIDTNDYEFSNATGKSRIRVEFTIEPDDQWGLQGTGENCDVIWKMVLTRLRPNVSA